jgi:hypothetical protein
MAVLIDEVDLLVAILMAFSLFPFFNSTSVTSFFLLGREIVEERYTQYKRPAVIACGLLFTHQRAFIFNECLLKNIHFSRRKIIKIVKKN